MKGSRSKKILVYFSYCDKPQINGTCSWEFRTKLVKSPSDCFFIPFVLHHRLINPLVVGDIPKICPRNVPDMSKICPRYISDLSQICSRCVLDMS